MEAINYSFKTLDDEAVKIDLFTDKTHERIAETLFQIITNDSSDGVTIGLEGSWGSGKSTVISILREKIRNVKIKYFYFDAWAHEGDPLRRIFLESLIKQLNTNNILDSLNEKISNRKKITTSKSKKYATKLGKFLSLAALFVPFGAGVISGIDYSNLIITFSSQLHIPFLIGSIFCFMPILVLLVNLLRCSIRKNRPVFQSENWAFLESESNNTITQEISEDEERSSIEFERYFRQVLEKIFYNESKPTKLLIVIDNLDRIDPEDSLKIWSTLQTFLQQRNPTDSDSELYKKVWVIIPYDQEGLAKLWKVKIECDMDEDDIEQVDVAKSFFEKNFQLRLDVPKPILSDWEDFTKTKINEALKKWPEEEKKEILSVIVNTRKSLADIPTPRQIKTFINQIGLLRMNASPAIPTKSIAYYVVIKYLNANRDTDSLRKEILDKKLPIENDLHFLPEECDMHLAGLIFGVNPTKGQQLLLEPEIENALKYNKIEEIQRIVDKHHAGFWSVFRFHITRITENEVLLPYSKTIYETLWNEYQDECQIFIKRLNTLDFSFPTENNIDYYSSSIKMLIESNYGVDKKWEQILTNFEENFNEEIFDVQLNINLLSKLADSFGERELKRHTINVQNLTRWEQWASESLEKKIHVFKWISPPPSIVNELADLIQPGQPILDAIFKTHKYSLKSGVKEWTPFVAACIVHISWNNGDISGNNHSAEVLKYLLPLLFIDSSVTNSIHKLLKAGPFFNFVHHQQAKQSVLYSAIMTAFYYKNKLHSFVVPVVANSENGIKLIRDFWLTKNDTNAQAVWNILEEYSNYSLIWDLIENSNNKLLTDLVSIGLKENSSEFFDLEDSLMKLHYSLNIVEKEHETILVQCFLNYTNIIEEIKETNDLDIIDCSHELQLVIDIVEDIEEIKPIICSKIIKVSKEEWIQSFREDSYLLSLIVSVKDKDTKFGLENNYLDGIFDFSEKWLTGELEPTKWIIDNWATLVRILKKNFQTSFKKKITDVLWKNLDDINIIAFDINVENFQIVKTINNNFDTLQKYLERSLNTETVLDKLKLLDRILSSDKKNSFKPESYFSDVISAPINNFFQSVSDDESKEMVIRIADRFKVTLKEEDTEE